PLPVATGLPQGAARLQRRRQAGVDGRAAGLSVHESGRVAPVPGRDGAATMKSPISVVSGVDFISVPTRRIRTATPPAPPPLRGRAGPTPDGRAISRAGR